MNRRQEREERRSKTASSMKHSRRINVTNRAQNNNSLFDQHYSSPGIHPGGSPDAIVQRQSRNTLRHFQNGGSIIDIRSTTRGTSRQTPMNYVNYQSQNDNNHCSPLSFDEHGRFDDHSTARDTISCQAPVNYQRRKDNHFGQLSFDQHGAFDEDNDHSNHYAHKRGWQHTAQHENEMDDDLVDSSSDEETTMEASQVIGSNNNK